jgi:hypothetical protein
MGGNINLLSKTLRNIECTSPNSAISSYFIMSGDVNQRHICALKTNTYFIDRGKIYPASQGMLLEDSTMVVDRLCIRLVKRDCSIPTKVLAALPGHSSLVVSWGSLALCVHFVLSSFLCPSSKKYFYLDSMGEYSVRGYDSACCCWRKIG